MNVRMRGDCNCRYHQVCCKCASGRYSNEGRDVSKNEVVVHPSISITWHLSVNLQETINTSVMKKFAISINWHKNLAGAHLGAHLTLWILFSEQPQLLPCLFVSVSFLMVPRWKYSLVLTKFGVWINDKIYLSKVPERSKTKKNCVHRPRITVVPSCKSSNRANGTRDERTSDFQNLRYSDHSLVSRSQKGKPEASKDDRISITCVAAYFSLSFNK